MKLINVSEGPVMFQDIDVMIPYTSRHEPVEIPDSKAMRSKGVRFAQAKGLVMNVTKRMPDEREIAAAEEAYRKNLQASRETVSEFDKRKAMLATDDKNPAATPRRTDPGSARNSCKEEYLKSGDMSAVWTGPAMDGGGYARMNRKFMFGLSEAGVRMRYHKEPSMEDMDPETMRKIGALCSVAVPADAPKIYGMTAPMHYDWARYKMLFTMMETRRLHKDYAYNCNCADEIIVPTRWCKDVFAESGVKKPIHVVPLGVDTSIYRPDVEPIGFSKSFKPFVFLSVFGWSLRKGYDVLIKAFLQEFTSDDPVTLLISSRYFGSTDESKKKVIRDEIARISAWVKNPKKPHVALFGDVLSDAMMPRLFAAASAYVLISRGEGFGLPYIEAGACRIPVIGSRYSGQTDFLDDSNSYLVDVDGFRPVERELSWVSKYYEDAEFPIFGDKAVEQTRAHMRRVFENREEAKAKAGRLYGKIVEGYDWSVCIRAMHDKLKQTYEERL